MEVQPHKDENAASVTLHTDIAILDHAGAHMLITE